MNIIRTNSSHSDFIQLVDKLNAYLRIVDGEEHEFYHQFNGIEKLQYVVIAYLDNRPVGCGAIKEFDSAGMEVKRMFTEPGYRGQGIASRILTELEEWSVDLNKKFMILETGKRQKEAVQLYRKMQYQVIPNYEPYIDMNNSICFKKMLPELS